MALRCPYCSFSTDTRRGLKIHIAKAHDVHGEDLSRAVNKALRNRGVNCMVCGKRIIPNADREDRRKIRHGKHEGKYLCVSCKKWDLK